MLYLALAAFVTMAPPPETAKVYAPASGLHPFDMKQCYDDDRGCQLVTCVRQPTQNGDLVLCQGHGTFFP
jgi:hypothetical protein